MKIDFIADTNILIYILEGNSFVKPLLDFSFGISLITEIELLGFKNLTEKDENQIHRLLNDCFVFNIDENIKKHTIEFRKNYSIKLPDAIIAATSMAYSIPLITADKTFAQIEEPEIIILNIK